MLELFFNITYVLEIVMITYLRNFIIFQIFVKNGKEIYIAGISDFGGYFDKDTITYASNVDTVGPIGPGKCVEDCLKISNCDAVNYYRSELKCEFLSFDSVDITPEHKLGSFYTEMDRWIEDQGPCLPNTCIGRTKCVETHLKQSICVKLKTICDSLPCQNNGGCRNDINDYSCACPDGYYGKSCQNTPCDSSPCLNDGHCVHFIGGFNCTCQEGFSGENCQYTPCTYISCSNGGQCVISGSTWNCQCLSGYYGIYCENTPCSGISCLNSGICTVIGSSWACTCPSGFSGAYCQNTPCSNIVCQNSGTCGVSGSSFVCYCLSGYSGTYCQRDPCYGVSAPEGSTCTVTGSTCRCCWKHWYMLTESCENY